MTEQTQERAALVAAIRDGLLPIPPFDAVCHRDLISQARCAHCSRIIAAHNALSALAATSPAGTYRKDFGDDHLCACGHEYYRHFDTYDNMRPIGCKYCECRTWTSPAGASAGAGEAPHQHRWYLHNNQHLCHENGCEARGVVISREELDDLRAEVVDAQRKCAERFDESVRAKATARPTPQPPLDVEQLALETVELLTEANCDADSDQALSDDTYGIIAAALRRVQPEPPQAQASGAWQPIATAPRDGSTILGFMHDWGIDMWGCLQWKAFKDGSAGWVGGSFHTAPPGSFYAFMRPTHWMPFPAPPQPERATTPEEERP